MSESSKPSSSIWTNERRVNHLLDAAEERLKQQAAGAPRQVNLRRAVSDVYYALFHFLIDQCTCNMIGKQSTQALFRDAIARGFPHSSLKEACKRFGSGGALPAKLASAFPTTSGVPSIPLALKRFARFFEQAQELRHTADYDWNESFNRRDVESHIKSARSQVRDFRELERTVEIKFFLAAITVWTEVKRS